MRTCKLREVTCPAQGHMANDTIPSVISPSLQWGLLHQSVTGFALTSILGAHKEFDLFLTGVNGTLSSPLDSERVAWITETQAA